MNKKLIMVMLAIFCLAALLMIPLTRSGAYDPWGDVSGPTIGVPDGTINMRDINYLINRFNTFGTPIDRSSLMSVAYDSGWVNITDKRGQYFKITHNLNSTDLIVDTQGKANLVGGPHQLNYGLMEHLQGWSENYGGTNREEAYALVQTTDGGYAMAGQTMSFGAGGYDFWLVKTDTSGIQQWNKTYGGANWEEASALVHTGDDGYALAGYTVSFGAGLQDVWLVKTDASGMELWNKTYGGSNDDLTNAIVQTTDDGYALAGYTASYVLGNGDFWLVKTDALGNVGGVGEYGLTWTNSTANTITLYRGATDPYWNYVRVRISKPAAP